jgi:hypothetical protein
MKAEFSHSSIAQSGREHIDKRKDTTPPQECTQSTRKEDKSTEKEDNVYDV